jgi:hypothetical protein
MASLSEIRPGKTEPLLLLISSIRTDGETQHRNSLDTKTVHEYAALMRDGVTFPPLRVWWDGSHYWLADGFHRLAAAMQANRGEMLCRVLYGSLTEAQWDSYGANTSHGLKRTPAEFQKTILLALRHPKARSLSNVEIAKHLHVGEATVRRWRRTLSSSDDEDNSRVVTRKGTRYVQRIRNIGRRSRRQKAEPRELQFELDEMLKAASPAVQPVLELIARWAHGSLTSKDCLQGMERMLQSLEPCRSAK